MRWSACYQKAPSNASQQLRLGDYILNVTFERQLTQPTGPQNPGVQTSAGSQAANILSGGLVIATGPNEFVFAGTGLTVTFGVETPGDPIVGILAADEGQYVCQWSMDSGPTIERRPNASRSPSASTAR